jgi:hypothetical protein
MGSISPESVMKWVDDVIATEEHPSDALIETSLSGDDVNRLIGTLNRVPGNANRTVVVRKVLHHMREALRQNPQRLLSVVRHLHRMAVDGDIPEPAAEGEMYRLADAFEMARGGIFGDISEIQKETEQFLERYADAAV